MGEKPKILLVEDDPNFGAVLRSYLEINDFEVTWIQDGALANGSFNSSSVDLVLLDVMLPHIDGFEIAREIRKKDDEIPIIFITAKKLKEDILEGFRTGADDYIVKPFDSEVLIFKVKAILRRNSAPGKQKEHIFRIGEMEFHFHERTVKSREGAQNLSPKEAELLRMLVINKNEVLKREEALSSIWGEESYFTTRSMDVFITKLRKILSSDPSVEIVTIHGTGFMLKCE